MHGLNTYDYGARQYDGTKIVWDRMDQFCEKYYHINPYVYCAGNPIRYVDPDGNKVIIPDKAAQAPILKYMNSLASGIFKVDKNGYLYQASKQTDGQHSKLYSERIVDEINSDDINYIYMNETYNNFGTTQDIDAVYGGGVTTRWEDGDCMTIISGKSQMVEGENGNKIEQSPAEILMHEIVGHSAPHMAPSEHDTGNAIKDENKVRDELNLIKRKENEGHVE